MFAWKLNALDPQIASVRYRALKPIEYLTRAGNKCTVYWGRQVIDWTGVKLFVNVKSYTFHDLHLVQSAVRRRIPVILDLCDNIFIETYISDKTLDPAHLFTLMSGLANAVTTSTDALASIIREHVSGIPVYVIPDGIEGPGDVTRMQSFVQRLTSKDRPGRLSITARALGSLRNPKKRRRTLGQLRAQYAYAKLDVKRRLRVRLVHFQSSVAKTPMQRILWFGNHGAPHASFGMLDLELIRPALERLSAEIPVELVVMSNSWAKYDAHIRRFAIPSRYVEWSPSITYSWLAETDVVVIPNNKDAFSICKSANRALLALSQGVPVVATYTDAYSKLRTCVLFDDWYENLRSCLTDSELVGRQIGEARRVLAEEFSDDALSKKWLEVVGRVRQPTPEKLRPGVAFFLGLVQDLEVVFDLIERSTQEFEVRVLLDVALVDSFPHVWDRLSRFERCLISGESLGEVPLLLNGIDLLVTASESNLRPHQLARRVTKVAKGMGIRTATLQHGIENIGLTYDDERQPVSRIEFAADHILTWGEASLLHTDVPEATREKCVPIGCPKSFVNEAIRIEAVEGFSSVVGIFENLHWTRYDEDYRTGFLSCLAEAAAAFPDVCFAVKPHPAGNWLAGRFRGPLPEGDNVVILSPADRKFRHLTASMVFPVLDAVITTPSTVALDALMTGLPVALVAGNAVFEVYEPLYMLRDFSDWSAFLSGCRNRDDRLTVDLEGRRSRFLESRIVPGDAYVRFAGIVRGQFPPVGER